ncbi:MAG: SIR2 family protein [Calothrix sp. MO_192.B10]|nr:SIR2 family protein [Calothrix sp. MO_192.B10]
MHSSRLDSKTVSSKIGILTALEKEYAAVAAVLENRDEVVFEGKGAGRRYLYGEVPACNGGRHSIVLALAAMGNNAASERATLLTTHFPKIESIIMVGIAGGVPHPEKVEDHVRLGDIVVSSEKGVVQYDFVKETVKETKYRHPPRPPSAALIEAVRLLNISEIKGERPWLKFIDRALEKGKVRPSEEEDILHDSNEPEKIILHPADPDRQLDQSRVFFGPIASANTLLKNPIKRDELRDKFGVKAVEMEGSGIADAGWNLDVGYLVIRGICDYCDSYKNDIWHPYGAAVAAAYTRALIESIPATDPIPSIESIPATDPIPSDDGNKRESDLLKEEFPKIADSVRKGKLIICLGSEINLADNKDAKCPPSDIQIAECLAEETDKRKTKNLIGLPCEVCPVKLTERPEELCPIRNAISSDTKDKLFDAQNLAFAKLEIRCWSEWIIKNADYQTLLTKLSMFFQDEDYQPNNLQNSLAELAAKIYAKREEDLEESDQLSQLMILTANYDVGLEMAFEEEKLDISVISYVIPKEKQNTGIFMHKPYKIYKRKYRYNDGTVRKINEADEKKELPLLRRDNKFPYIKNPVIFKIYGGVLYKNDQGYDSFAVAERHHINYLKNPQEKLPDTLINYFTHSNILFIGYSANDVNLRAILHYFFQERWSKRINPGSREYRHMPQGWLIHKSNLGEITDKTYYKHWGIKLIEDKDNTTNSLLDYLKNNL